MLRRHIGQTALGGSIAGATSYAFSRQVAPGLLAGMNNAADTQELFRGLPYLGPMLGSTLGAGGTFGCMAIALCLVTSTVALLTSGGPVDARLKWTLAHVAQGLALSPLWLLPAAGTVMPPALAAAAVTIGLSLLHSQVLSERLDHNKVSVSQAIASMTLSFAGSPIPAELALGMAPHAIAASTGAVLALGLIALSAHLYRSAFDSLDDETTAFLRGQRTEVDPKLTMNMPGKDDYTLYYDPVINKRLFDKTQSLKINFEAGLDFSKQFILLSGPAGTGKGSCVHAMHNVLGWPVYPVNPEKIIAADSPVKMVRSIFDQAKKIRDMDKRPLTIVIDEADILFPDPETLSGLPKRQAEEIFNTFKYELEGIDPLSTKNILFVFLTNHPDQFAPAIKSRLFSGSINLGQPTVTSAAEIFRIKWREHHGSQAALQVVAPFAPSDADLATFVAITAPDGEPLLSGREIEGCVKNLMEAANVHFHRHKLASGVFNNLLKNKRSEAQAAFDAYLRRELPGALQATRLQALVDRGRASAQAQHRTYRRALGEHAAGQSRCGRGA